MNTTTNPVPVDVLAVIRRERKTASLEQDRASGRGGKDLTRLTEAQADAAMRRMENAAAKRKARYDEAVAAEAAMADLIGAAKALHARVEHSHDTWPEVHELRAALARCGGAS